MLTLKHGASSLVVAPEHGGGLIGWMLGPDPVLRRAVPQAVIGGNPHALGCFPLLPYANRVGHRRFRWRNREYELRGNFGDNTHTIHGLGWQRPWTVTAVAENAATLTLEHDRDADWPFAFDASLTYHLDATLTIGISLTNRHPEPAPAGIGLHPFFPRAGDPALEFQASGAWHNGPDGLPETFSPPPADWRHTRPRRIVTSRLDNCFTGWDGAATTTATRLGLHMQACSTFGCLQVFTPDWADFFCVEPVSHMPDAINRPDLPAGQAMRCLAPGETLHGTIRLTPQITGQAS